MVAVLILSTTMLALAYLQIVGLRTGVSAYYRTQATVLAYDMAERMRSNTANAPLYVMPLGAGAPAGTANAVATGDRTEWRSTLATTLPTARGGVAFTGGVATITVAWYDMSQQSAATTQTYTYSTRL